MAKSLLKQLRSALKTDSDLSKILDVESLTLAQAEELCTFLDEQSEIGPLLCEVEDSTANEPLYYLTMAFQAKMDEVTTEHMRAHGLPNLLRLCDLALAMTDPPEDTLPMLAKMFAYYEYEPGVERIADVARRLPDSYFVSVSFGMLGREEHPHGPALVKLLSDPLPGGFAAVLLLDLANTLSRQKRLDMHPFNTPDGHDRLESWITNREPEDFSYAVSSAAALPFIDSDITRNRLAALAMDHLDSHVQMEAAWASAYRGSEAGLKFLARMTTDVCHSITAQRYLEDLERTDVIPDEAKKPDFQAMAELANWLAHPNELGKPPTEVEVIDTRVLHWPPTNDTRQVWLIQYRYADVDDNDENDDDDQDDGDEFGIGMVGSTTFVLFGERKDNMSAEDIYGLHCCWELEMNGDKRAPKKRSAKAGRKLLGI